MFNLRCDKRADSSVQLGLKDVRQRLKPYCLVGFRRFCRGGFASVLQTLGVRKAHTTHSFVANAPLGE